MEIVIGLVIGLALAAGVFWVGRREAERLRGESSTLRGELATVREEAQRIDVERATANSEAMARKREAEQMTAERDEARLQLERRAEELSESREELQRVSSEHDARMDELDKKNQEIDRLFKSVAADVAKASNEEFRKQAAEDFKRQRELAEQELKQQVAPVGKELESLRKYIAELEQARTGAYEGVSKLIEETQRQVSRLNTETGDLREILRSDRHRGKWGERTLENILELAGLRRNVDFQTQQSGEDGSKVPDVVVRIPGGQKVIIDAKTPFDAYREALDADTAAEQAVLLQRHADRVLQTAKELRAKKYESQVRDSLDFVVMFIPTDSILEGATRAMPRLIETAFEKHRVLLATPVTMIALLSGLAAALRQEEEQELLHENAVAIQAAGQRLYDGVRRHAQVYGMLGGQIQKLVKVYDDGIGSLQGNLLHGARQMRELGGGRDGIAAPEPPRLHLDVKRINRPELLGSDQADE